MIQAVHKLLTSNAVTRRLQRGLVLKLKSWMGCPDRYRDFLNLERRTSPDAILDIGCHLGDTIARFLETSRVPIHGFEPTPQTFEKLSQRFADQSQVRLHPIALSNETGTAVFHCNANDQTNSLLDNDIGNRQALSDYTEHVGAETISTVRLDEWTQEHLPQGKLLIKSDVQGAEKMLLEGGSETFPQRVVGFLSEAQIAPMYSEQADFCELHQILTKRYGFVLHNVLSMLSRQTRPRLANRRSLDQREIFVV